MINSQLIKEDFPILKEKVGSYPLTYLDNAATTQKPKVVVDAIAEYYYKINANPHRGAHTLSHLATEAYEKGRETVANFIGASDVNTIVFTHNTTEAINLVAKTFLKTILSNDDHITVSVTDHHSCMLPAMNIADNIGANIDQLTINQDYDITDTEIKSKIHAKTKMVFIGHISNVLGSKNPIEAIIKRCREVGAYILVDGAQAVPHMPINVEELDVDFYCFSAHKMLGPMGIGVLYGKSHLLKEMTPYNHGGNMVNFVTGDEISYKDAPHKFEAGTQNVEGVYAFTKAIEYLNELGMDQVKDHEEELLTYALEQLETIHGLKIYGTKDPKSMSGVLSFNIEGIHPHDIASILDMRGIAIRSGFHCAQPLMQALELPSTCRVSFYIYNDKEDIDALVQGLIEARRLLHYEPK